MKKLSLLTLFLANLLPAAGIFLFGWNLFSILFFYWLESGVVGIFNVFKMLLIKPSPRHKKSGVIFFFLHYSGFMLGHGYCIWALFSPEDISISMTAVLSGLLSLGISHGVSFKFNYIGRREYEKLTISQQMVAPYRRIMIMHVTIIVCAFLLNLFPASNITLMILIACKIIIDIIAHIREHARLNTYTTKATRDIIAGIRNGPTGS